MPAVAHSDSLASLAIDGYDVADGNRGVEFLGRTATAGLGSVAYLAGSELSSWYCTRFSTSICSIVGGGVWAGSTVQKATARSVFRVGFMEPHYAPKLSEMRVLRSVFAVCFTV